MSNPTPDTEGKPVERCVRKGCKNEQASCLISGVGMVCQEHAHEWLRREQEAMFPNAPVAETPAAQPANLADGGKLEELVDDFARYVWRLSGHNFEQATHHQYLSGRDLWLNLKLKAYFRQKFEEALGEDKPRSTRTDGVTAIHARATAEAWNRRGAKARSRWYGGKSHG